MNAKRKLCRLWLTTAILLGAGAVMWQAYCDCLRGMNDCTPSTLLFFSAIYTGTALVAVALFMALFKPGSRFFRWLFTWRIFKRWLAAAVPLGAAAALLQIYYDSLRGVNDCTLSALFFFALIYTGAALVALACLLALLKLAGCFFRWLFVWRRLKRWLTAAVVLLVLILAGYAEEDWRGWHAWNTFKHEAEARGEKFDFASFIPPPVPDDQNFALAPVVAGSYRRVLGPDGNRLKHEDTNIADRLQMSIYHHYDYDHAPANGDWETGHTTDLKAWQEYYRRLSQPEESHIPFGSPFGMHKKAAGLFMPTVASDSFRGTNDFETPQQPQSPAEDILLALRKFNSTLEELRQASLLPGSRFPLNYEVTPPASICQPHLASLQRCGQVLKLRAAAELELGRREPALADVKLELRLAEAIRREPFMLSQMVRADLLLDALQPVADGLVKHRWTDPDLLELESHLGPLDLLADRQTAVRGELAAQLGTIDWYQHPRNYRHYAGYSEGFGLNYDWSAGMVLGALGFHLLPAGWFDQLRLQIAQTNLMGTLQLVDASRHLVFPEKELELTDHINLLRPWPLFRADFDIMYGGYTERRIIYAQAALDLARVAGALERCRLTAGEYPETLDALSPRFLKTIPHDMIGGQPLHYHRTEDGRYQLYSIGWNQKDDGGKYGSKDQYFGLATENGTEEGDWVWPSPAK